MKTPPEGGVKRCSMLAASGLTFRSYRASRADPNRRAVRLTSFYSRQCALLAGRLRALEDQGDAALLQRYHLRAKLARCVQSDKNLLRQMRA